ncbi:MAG TPA: M14 family metallopeptidase, partial [Bacteroidales bacterium]|nr:M14 family metallopeptidase [Bacteroidales bacterium]
MKHIFLFFFLLAPFTIFAQSTLWPEVRIHATPEQCKRLAAAGLAVEDGSHNQDGTWTTVLSQRELEILTKEGIRAEVLHPDYPRFISDRNREESGWIERFNHRGTEKSTLAGNYPVPAHFRMGSMGGYLTLDEVASQLDSMRLLYPGLISVKASAGNASTIEGRPIWYVMISNSPNQVTEKPAILYNALIHAREPMGMQQLIFFMWSLLENYESSAEVKYLVDNLQLFFIPVMNPDGYQYNCASYPFGGGQWRKNRRDNGGGEFGVDLNRNFGYKWGYDNTGSSPDPSQETYRGTGPFSEPETQGIRDFCILNHFSVIQNYHTYSDYNLWPWCYITADTPDSTLQTTFSRFITRQNGYLAGHPGEILYNTNGDALDWQYGEQSAKPKSFSFTSEIGKQSDGFWPSASRILPLAQENMYSNLILAHLALRYAEVSDASPVILSSRQGRFAYSFMRYGLDGPAPYTVTLRPADTSQFLSWGGPKTYSDPAQLVPVVDSVDYTLVPTVTSGDEIRLVYEIDNGLYIYRDTIVKFYGPPLVVFSDSCNSLANWTSAKWNITASKYHSPPSCITDSPSGNYPNNSTSTVNSTAVDLKGSPVAVINFWTRWRTEQGYDYAQFRLQGNQGPWIPQPGKFTKTSYYQEVTE